MSRYRWPMHFGLLNNDCLWVMDEVQLMGAGLASTSQLEGFREDKRLGASLSHSWWMSATLAPEWLATVDLPAALLHQEPLQLDSDKNAPRVAALRSAPKAVEPASTPSSDEKAVAAFVAQHRSRSGLNLVVVNTVPRTQNLHRALTKIFPKEEAPPLLLHSQFRPDDRRLVLEALRNAPPGSIAVSTQVIEAGVDLSCHTLFTELAPWSSMVQRFGRCNRWLKPDAHPQFTDARIFWFDLDAEKQAAPYEAGQLAAAREILANLRSAALEDLESIPPTAADRPNFRHVVRRKDLVELFDTTPDLADADLDVDRFIRDANQSHVSVFWREWTGANPNGENGLPEPSPHRKELCPTRVEDLRKLLGKDGIAWRWNFLDRAWQPCKEAALLPGQTYLLCSSQGGYDAGAAEQLPLGWKGKSTPPVPPVPIPQGSATPEDNAGDSASQLGAWQTIAQHTDAVHEEMRRIAAALQTELQAFCHGTPDLEKILMAAARWHDLGKVHAAFQAKLHPEALSAASLNAPAAKAPSPAWRGGRLPGKPVPGEARRRHFRHELASALGMLHPDSGFPLTGPLARNLAAYLVAAHHGKVRLSIRSLPGEWIPPIEDAHPQERRFARGVWDGDTLDAIDLGGGINASAVTLSLELMELGLCEAPPFENQPSWAERSLTLRDTLGPFALAYLESLLRAADARASASHDKEEKSAPVVRDEAAAFGVTELTDTEKALVASLVEDGLAIQDRFRPEPLYRDTGKGHYESRTVEDIANAKGKQRKP